MDSNKHRLLTDKGGLLFEKGGLFFDKDWLFLAILTLTLNTLLCHIRGDQNNPKMPLQPK